MKRLVLSLACLLLCVGCKFNKKNEQEKFRYQYSSNGCTTGVQEFSHREDWCRGLLDEGRNNHCARSIREDAHRRQCTSRDGAKTIAESPTPTVPDRTGLSL